MAARSIGTSFSLTFAVTTGASPPPPPPPAGPAADVLLLQADAAATAAAHKEIISARLKDIGSTRGYEDSCGLFTGNSSFDVSLQKTYLSRSQELERSGRARRHPRR